MDTLVRSTTLGFSRRFNGYEPLDHGGVTGLETGDSPRTFSWRRSGKNYNHMIAPISYESLDHQGDRIMGKRTFSRRTFSKRKSSEQQRMMSSDSYRRDRARKRRIFLQTYKLGAMDSTGKSTSRKLKKIVVKVKSVLFSAVSFMRLNSLKGLDCRSAICASSPTPNRKCI